METMDLFTPYWTKELFRAINMKKDKKIYRVWVNNWAKDESVSVDFNTLVSATAYATSVITPNTDATIFHENEEVAFYDMDH